MMRSQVQPVPNVIPANMQQMLFVGKGMNFQSVVDQQLTKMFTGTRWMPLNVAVIVKSGAFSVTCIGGMYTGAGKTGIAMVSALQTWTGLIGADSIVLPAISAFSNVFTSSTLYLSLTTGNLLALTADLFVSGLVLD